MEAQTNAYTPPTGELFTPSEGFYTPKLFSLKGRIGRLRFFAYSFGFSVLVTIAIGVIAAIVGPMISVMILGGNITGPLIGLALLGVLIIVGVIAFSYILMIRRLNDIDQSGWLSLLSLIPGVNLILLVFVWFVPGTKGSNRYGLPPTANPSGVVILAAILAVLMLSAFFAAVALPAYQDYTARAKQVADQSAINASAGDTSTTENAAPAEAASAEGDWIEEKTSANSEAVQ